MDSRYVYAVQMENYQSDSVVNSMKELLIDHDLLDFVKPGMKIAIKANLVAAAKPEEAVTTHPALLKELCRLLLERGALVFLGDSPGGLFQSSTLEPIYHKAGLLELEKMGVTLNRNYGQSRVAYPNGKAVHELDTSNWLTECDAIINFAKLKSHGMMSLSSAVKNMFGSVPGTLKLEYHYRYPNHVLFSNMLVDIQEYYHCALHIVDACDAMEGNGPTQGTPRHIGVLMASKMPYHLDLASCTLMNLNTENVPTIKAAIARGLSKETLTKEDISLDLTPYIVEDFEKIENKGSIEFFENDSFFLRVIGKIAKFFMQTKPKPKKKECIGCKKCANICPAKAITMKNGKPSINRKACIRCFCCQEFCPVGAMKNHRSLVGKILSHTK